MNTGQPSFRGVRPRSPAFFSEAIAFTLNHEGVAVMEQAIEDRRGEDVVAEDRRRRALRLTKC